MGCTICKQKEEPQDAEFQLNNNRRKKNFMDQLRTYFIEYAYITDIHGVRYLAEERSLCEKLFWLVLSLISTVGCIILFVILYRKYAMSAVRVSYSTQHTSIDQIPFPAVTICSETKVQKKYLDYLSIRDKLKNNQPVTEEELRRYQYLYMVCDHRVPKQYRMFKKHFTEDFYSFLSQVHPKFEDLFHECFFWGEEVNCTDLFRPIISSEGICHTFNLVDRTEMFNSDVYFHDDFYAAVDNKSDWFTETGYQNAPKVTAYPVRAQMSGADNSMMIRLIQRKEDFDQRCKSSLQGFRVLLHTPMEQPLMSKYYFRVALGTSTVAAVQPKLMMTSHQVKTMAPEQRNCYLQHERPLVFYEKYTQNNCMTECITNHTIKRCGCVNFYMPRFKNTTICGAGKWKCIKDAEDELEIFELESHFFKNNTHGCDCKPACTELSYNMELSVSGWDWKNFFETQKKLFKETVVLDENKTEMSALVIFLKSEYFLNLQRNERYGLAELIAGCGGVLSLFMGISLLTLVEIFYFLTIRILCNKRLYGIWYGGDEEATYY